MPMNPTVWQRQRFGHVTPFSRHLCTSSIFGSLSVRQHVMANANGRRDNEPGIVPIDWKPASPPLTASMYILFLPCSRKARTQASNSLTMIESRWTGSVCSSAGSPDQFAIAGKPIPVMQMHVTPPVSSDIDPAQGISSADGFSECSM